VKNVDPIATRQYIERADHFFHAMRLAADDMPSYRTSIGLLAVHSAISLNDAIATGVTGGKSKHQDHSEAARDLEKISKKSGVSDLMGISHFRWLLQEKSRIAYGRERLDNTFILLSITRAERFHAWAYNQFREILHASAT
jgi:hypothetical protein